MISELSRLLCCQDNADVFAITERLVATFDSVSKELDTYGRKKEEDQRRFHAQGIDFKWDALKALREETVGLAKR